METSNARTIPIIHTNTPALKTTKSNEDEGKQSQNQEKMEDQ